MAVYYQPDRSDRPISEDNINGRVVEFYENVNLVGELPDGRPYVFEMCVIDGFPSFYLYFDKTGLENATVEELTALINDDWRVPFPSINPEVEISYSVEDKQDAQGRPIWEFNIFFDCELDELFIFDDE